MNLVAGQSLHKKKDPLVTLAFEVPSEMFRPKPDTGLASQDSRTPAAERKGAAGRQSSNQVLIFKALVVQAFYNLSDERAEDELRDWLSFMCCLGLGLEDATPDATPLWLYREAPAPDGALTDLFSPVDGYPREQGFFAMGGQIVDAALATTARQPNSRDENAAIKRDETPAGWEQHFAKSPSARFIKDYIASAP